MSTMTGLIVAVVLTVVLLAGCTGGDAKIVTIAHNATIKLTCTAPNGRFPPQWFMNGTLVATEGHSYRSITNTSQKTSTLMIDGNFTCETFNLHCEFVTVEPLKHWTMYITNLTIHGRLHPPQNVTRNSSTIEWRHPYSEMNKESDIMHVDPHITQYTVYITDMYTNDSIVKVNVTETQYTHSTQDGSLCPMYQVSAWNAGGEGKKCDPVWDSTPQVPRSIAAENISVTVAVEVLYIRIDVDVVCTSRIPEFFLISWLTSAGGVLNETTIPHEPEIPVADFTISLPQTVDVCTHHVRISAGNSAGMSAPSEAIEVGCPHGSTDSATTASTTTATSAGSESGGSKQGVSTTLIAIIIAVTAVTVVGVLMATTVGIICYKNYKRRKIDHSDQADGNNHYYSASPSLSGPVPLYKPPVTEAVYATSEQTTSRPVARDPENTAVWMDTLDSAPSTLQTGSSTESGHSSDLLLPPSRPAPVGGSQLMYAELSVKQTQVHPPDNDDNVQYAQIAHQD